MNNAIIFETKTTDCGDKLVEAIKALCNNPEGLDNLRFYVNNHGEKWFSVFCKDIDGLISELEMFSKHIV